MSRPRDGDPVPENHSLLRLPRRPEFMPEDWRPTPDQFKPSSADRADSANRGTPVRVSAWDEALTTVSQARVFRRTETIVLRVENQAILELATRWESSEIRAVYDSLESPEDVLPGAAGHAGIEGLDRRKGASKRVWMDMLNELAARAHLVDAE